MPAERAVLAGVLLPENRLDEEEVLDEFESLARSAGAVSVGRVFQHRKRYDPAHAIGRGKVEEIIALCVSGRAETILFLNDLSPVQQRNLEEETNRKVVDRAALILDIFAQRARTKEGKLQVELAQLQYRLTHLTGRGVLLSRLGGGIGTRGPGEQKLESDRRRIAERIRKLGSEIEKVRRHRRIVREGRRKLPFPLVSLVGYTNAGKTSLLNALTHARAWVADQLFATLDPLVRQLFLPGGEKALLSDTVGFLRDFPPQLAAAFRATLEELEEASLLLLVADASHPQVMSQVAVVQEVLGDLHLDDKPVLHVFNKRDLITPQTRKELIEAFPQAVFVSALQGEGLEELKERVKNSAFTMPRR